MRMRWNRNKKHDKRSAGKVVTGLLLGSVLGATVGWLTAPASGEEIRRRVSGELKSAREKAKTSEGNVESRARELANEVRGDTEHPEQAVARHRGVASGR